LAKLSYWHLEPYIVKTWVRFMAYWLKLLSTIKRLSDIVKLTTISEDLIFNGYLDSSPNLILIDRQKEYKVKKILHSY